MKSSPDPLTEEARFFLQPASPAHRQYEALRAFFVDGISSQQAPQNDSAILTAPFVFSATTSAAPSLISSATSNPVPAANPRKTPSASSSWPCASRIFPSMTSSDP